MSDSLSFLGLAPGVFHCAESFSLSFDRTPTTLESDLLWAINSPSLVEFGPQTWRPDRLDSSLIERASLLQALAQPSPRVGHYFEQLVQFYLQHLRQCDLLAAQQPVCAGGRTVGEFDFVFREPCGQTVHLETAVKFYLHLPNRTHQGSQLVGPNAADNFEKKAERILSHQLTLANRFPVQAGERFGKVDQAVAMVKGRIYYHHASQATASTAASQFLAKDHQRGVWFHAAEWTPAAFPKHSHVEFLPKPYWLTGSPHSEKVPVNQMADLIKKHFAETCRPIHGRIEGEAPQFFFIVSDAWPEDSRAAGTMRAASTLADGSQSRAMHR